MLLLHEHNCFFRSGQLKHAAATRTHWINSRYRWNIWQQNFLVLQTVDKAAGKRRQFPGMSNTGRQRDRKTVTREPCIISVGKTRPCQNVCSPLIVMSPVTNILGFRYTRYSRTPSFDIIFSFIWTSFEWSIQEYISVLCKGSIKFCKIQFHFSHLILMCSFFRCKSNAVRRIELPVS